LEYEAGEGMNYEQRRRERRKRIRRKSMTSTMLQSFFATVVVVGAIVVLTWLVIVPHINIGGLPFLENREEIAFHDYFSLAPDITHIILDDAILRDVTPLVETRPDGHTVFLPASFMRDLFDPFMFWDYHAEAFFISTRYDMLEFTPGLLSYTENGSHRTLSAAIRYEDGEIYLPAELLEGLYPISITYGAEYSLVVISTWDRQYQVAEVTANTASLRYRAENRAPIGAQIAQGEEVVLFGFGTDADFMRVRTAQGLIGYIATSDLGRAETRDMLAFRTPILGYWVDNLIVHPPAWNGGSINMVWELATNHDATNGRMEIPFHPSINIVSPTWMEFDTDIMGLRTIVNRTYIEWARSQGVQVWPKVFDLNLATARAILMDRDVRNRVVAQIIHYVDTYNLPGINIDIEHLQNSVDGTYKIQFLRELQIPLRQRGVVLSAAVKVPMADNHNFAVYRHDLIGLTMDFIMLMAYDQHSNTSAVSGPVASLQWVNQAVINLLEVVHRDQIVLGLPFYNRVWREFALDDGPHANFNWTMERTRDFFEYNGVEWEWDSTIASFYGRVGIMDDGQVVNYRVWLECELSIEAKMQIFVVHNLAGVAGWRRLFETADVQEVIAGFF